MTTPNAPAVAAPPCARCKSAPGVVYDGTARWCVECAGSIGRDTRAILNAIGDAVRAGLPAWPRCLDRVEFVRECIKLHRESAVQEAGLMPNAPAVAAPTEAEIAALWDEVATQGDGSFDEWAELWGTERRAAIAFARALLSRAPEVPSHE